MKTKSMLLLFLMVFPLLLPVPAIALPQAGPDPAATQADGSSKGKTDENPFISSNPTVDIWRAIGLMKDFKMSSLILLLVLLFPAVVICRRYIHKSSPDSPVVVTLAAMVIYYVLFLLINFGLYWLAVHYGWLGFSDLNSAVNTSDMWLQINKTWSLGLGSFYIAHVIDAFIAAILFFFALIMVLSFYNSKIKPRG